MSQLIAFCRAFPAPVASVVAALGLAAALVGAAGSLFGGPDGAGSAGAPAAVSAPPPPRARALADELLLSVDDPQAQLGGSAAPRASGLVTDEPCSGGRGRASGDVPVGALLALTRAVLGPEPAGRDACPRVSTLPTPLPGEADVRNTARSARLVDLWDVPGRARDAFVAARIAAALGMDLVLGSGAPQATVRRDAAPR